MKIEVNPVSNLGTQLGTSKEWIVPVFRIRDPVLFYPRIRDGAMVGSGSGISKQNLLIAFIQQ
jgi:hypothetical protein